MTIQEHMYSQHFYKSLVMFMDPNWTDQKMLQNL